MCFFSPAFDVWVFLHPKSGQPDEVKMHSQCLINADGSAEIRSVRMPKQMGGVTSRGLRGCLGYNIVTEQLILIYLCIHIVIYT